MKILIVDDSATMRMILKKGLTSALKGTDVIFLNAADGQAGLDNIKENLDIDYIFLDVNMPIMNGDKMLEIMRSTPEMKHIKVIMQTTEGSSEKVKFLSSLGISGYLLKPYTLDIVKALMERLISVHAQSEATA